MYFSANTHSDRSALHGVTVSGTNTAGITNATVLTAPSAVINIIAFVVGDVVMAKADLG